jgi:DNA topoisomerase-1
MFAPDYEPHGKPLIYEGKEVFLPVDAEEVATYWAAVKGTDYESKEVFIKNFWQAFTERLPENLKYIDDFKKCDWSRIQAHREIERQKRLDRPRDEKERLKAEADAQAEWYSHSIVDGVREKLGNYRLEPPSLFRGRGEHPKQGMLKKRTWPESCVMNVGMDAPVPRPYGCPGHAWKDVVHENHVQWIASFDDSVLMEPKYVSFAATSGLKGQPDMLKYDRARRLLAVVDKIRESYTRLQSAKSLVDRQKATATYIIDRLALRVGGEKDTEEEADTVGCCSLRVEHVKCEAPDTVHFSFLGKDSILYENSVKVTEQVWANLKAFQEGKSPKEDLFDKIKPTVVNDYFKEFMEDLSAKVFRTFNASYTLQTELAKFDVSQKDKWTQDELVKFYNDANRQVAILCNHQKAASKGHEAAMEKMEEQKSKLETQVKQLKEHLKSLTDPSKRPVKDPIVVLPKDEIGTKKKIAETRMRLDKQVNAMRDKEDNKSVSLGTSKVNYMDPRITVSWCKKVDLAIERVFPRTVRTKFPWAMHFKSVYQFD